MVCGAFSARGLTPLLRVQGSTNWASYVDVLESVVATTFALTTGRRTGPGFRKTWPLAIHPRLLRRESRLWG